MKQKMDWQRFLIFQSVLLGITLSGGGSVYANSDLQGLAKRFLSTVGAKLDKVEQTRLIETANEENSLVAVSEGEDLVFSLKKGGIVLSEAIFAQKKNGKLYILFSDFLRAVDFPIDVDPENKTAQGWFVREENVFSMDLNALEIIVNGFQIALEPDSFFEDQSGLGGYFIEASILERAFSVGFRYRVSSLEMFLTSDFTLPVEEKIYRQQRRKSLFFSKNESVLPEVKQEYKLATVPFVDVQVSNSYQKREGGNGASIDTGYSIITANDMAYGGLKTYLSGDDTEKIEQFRFDWTKEAQSEDEGVLGFNRIQVGDITTPRLNVFRGGGQEFGVRVSNESSFSDKRDEKTDVTRFEGDIQPGWDIEVYRNNILVATHAADASGRYVIEDVPLTFGENNFRLVFYGPQGQLSEKEELIIRKNNRFDVGEMSYSLSLTNQNEVTYKSESSDVSDPLDSGSLNLIGTLDFGLSEDYSLSLGGRVLERNNQQRYQLAAGLTGYFDTGIYEANLGLEDTGEFAVEFSSLSYLWGQSLRTNTEIRTDDFDISRPSDDNIIHYSEASMSGYLLDDVNYLARVDYRRYKSGGARKSLGLDVSKKIYRGLIGVGYDYVDTDLSGVGETTQAISLNGRYNLGGYFVRGNISYDLSPDPEARSYFLSLNKRFEDNLTGEVQLEHLPKSSLTELRGRLNYLGENFTISPDIRINSDSEVLAFTTLRFGLGADPYSDHLKMHQTGLTSRGGVSARVFLDEDGDGVWDIYEKPMPGVKVMGQQISQSDLTDEAGVAFIPSFNAGQLTDITIDPKTLEDPYFISLNKGNAIRARAGQITKMDFPIAVSGEIDGSVFFIDKYGNSRPLANMSVFLVDMDGKITNTALTAYDGFYVIGDVYPGDYHLILDPVVLEQKNLVQVEPKGYRFAANGTVFYDQGFSTYSKDILSGKLEEMALDPKESNKLVLELGRYKSKLMLAVEWLKYKFQHRDLLVGLSTFEGLVENDINEADVRYPLHLGPIKDVKKAEEVCNSLKSRGVECMLRTISTVQGAKDRKV